MRGTRWTTVLACVLVPAVIAWVVADLVLRHQGWLAAPSLWGGLLALLTALAVLVAGLAVRRLRAHEPTWMTPTGAATTAVAAQASALVGAGVSGVYSGVLLVGLLAPDSPAASHLVRTCLACLTGCLLWCATGLLVEHWCTIDTSQDDDPGHAPGGASSSARSDSAPACRRRAVSPARGSSRRRI